LLPDWLLQGQPVLCTFSAPGGQLPANQVPNITWVTSGDMNTAGQTYALSYDSANDVTQFLVNQGVVTYVDR
jgi:hypothetical protein